MNITEEKLSEFIQHEKELFSSQKGTNIVWDSEVWEVENWLFHRGKDSKIYFTTITRLKNSPKSLKFPSKGRLPSPFVDFVKAVAVYLQRTKGVGFMAVRNYVNECRRLYLIMNQRKETSPIQLTRWHFEETIDLLRNTRYKNIYDAAANLQVIAEVIDKKGLASTILDFKHGMNPSRNPHSYKTLTEADDNERISEGKLFSLGAIKAYAQCTNKPISNEEEILLRTIDLLIAMGQRANEVTLIPYDCWIENEIKEIKNSKISDVHVGIKYYAEKQFQSRVHWLAQQDIPFARRAVERLKVLTKEAREVAKWQEDHPGKLWNLNPNSTIDDDTLLNYVCFKNVFNLQNNLTRINGIKPVLIDKNLHRDYLFEQNGYKKKYLKRYHYRVSDIEKMLLPRLTDHIVLKEKVNGEWKTVLKTSEALCIRFEGAFRFKERKANIIKVLPGRISVQEINSALGASTNQSIFERRNFTEVNGSKIIMTSHQPRHWRNTLYELAGMSNVQQALALGRQNLDQNTTYQHTTIKERTQSHTDFIAFNSIADKRAFLHEGIRSNKILGSITDTYNLLIKEKGIDTAEIFLKTHAHAIHLTPFGGCTHDFSQAPCPKHLQCWNGCSHLHRTNTPGETERIKEQLNLSTKALEKMKSNSEEYGSDVWIKDLENKVDNLKKAVNIKPSSSPIPVSPEGIQMTIPINERKASSVSDNN